MNGKSGWFLSKGLITALAVLMGMALHAWAGSTDKPKYGGVLIQSQSVEPITFDEADGHQGLAPTLFFTNEDLTTGDWAKGPTGTGEISWLYSDMPPMDFVVGALAESWRIVDDTTFVFHIRKGVHWHDKPPVNGREMTAEDVEFSLRRLFFESPKCYNGINYGKHIESLEVSDKWNVVVKVAPGQLEPIFGFMAQHSTIIPPEVVKEHGNMKDWRNACGTGPFMLTDYVPGNSVTFVRNPNYWKKDPLHPENRLPYLDGVKWFIIPDLSTQFAALRTAKIDWLPAVTWEDGASLLKTNPGLKQIKYNRAHGDALHLRVNDPTLAFYHKKVRQALAMAVDQKLIADTYHGGNAVLRTHPFAPLPEYKHMWIPHEELPKIVQEQFEYHPEKAKQLLAEAGYPNGFKTSVLCYKTHVDILSMVKDFWKKVGVELELDVKEYAAYTSLGFERKYEAYCYPTTSGQFPFRFFHTMPKNPYNFCVVDDPLANKAYEEIAAAWPDEAKRGRILKELTPHLLEEGYILQLPSPDYYNFWQPWLKGYTGETTVGRKEYGWPMYVWVDQNLKEERAGKR